MVLPLLQEQEDSLGCTLSLSPPQLILSDPRAQIFRFSSLPGGISPGFFQQKPRDAFVGPRERVVAAFCRSSPASSPRHGRGMFLEQGSRNAAGWECGGVGSCAHAGSRRSLLSSLLCPRSCSVWDSPSTSADLEFSRWDRGGEGRGKRGKLFLLGCFPSRRVKNPAQAQPG